MIFVIRHGQTELNSAHALQGRSDLPLNHTGVRQAEEAGRALRSANIHFDRVYSSPAQRAVQTARIVSPNTPVHTDDRLLEMDYGPYEGIDLTCPPPEIVTFFSDFTHNPAPEGMEQLSEVVARTGAFVEEILALPHHTLVSTHAIAMKGILEYLTPDSQGGYWSKYIGNCAIYTIDPTGSQGGIPTEWHPLSDSA
ncbi:MAG: histidine phosphatase family protein [Atopobiaceae bacterium]|nr:histidine phosphatase family protein [Atopobiaceae bacterium]